MEWSLEQLQEIKEQLIEQIETSFPEDKKQSAIEQIEEMNNEQLIEFLKQNNLIKEKEEAMQNSCVFCSIVFGDIPSIKINENEEAVAILEINPISEGHTIIIPKNHVEKEEDLSEKIKELAKQTKHFIQNSFNPKEIPLIPINVMGHYIINILPVYEKENMHSKRTKKTPEQLQEVKQKIERTSLKLKEDEKIKEDFVKERKKEFTDKEIKIPKRIP